MRKSTNENVLVVVEPLISLCRRFGDVTGWFVGETAS